MDDVLKDLKAVLCTPDGKVCIAGSQGDRDIISKCLVEVAKMQEKISDYNTKFLHQDRIIDDLEKELEYEQRK